MSTAPAISVHQCGCAANGSTLAGVLQSGLRSSSLQEASKTSRASALRQLRNPAAHWTGEIGAATVWTPGDLKWQSSALPASVRYLSSNNSTLLLQKRGLELIDLRTLEG